MSMFRKLATLFNAGAQQPVQHLIDHHAIMIFEQEIRQAEEALPAAKHHLAAVMAERKKLERDIESITLTLQTRLVQASAALEKQEDNLARELADLIADDENLLDTLKQQINHLRSQEAQLTQQMRKAVQSIKHYQRELALAKANRHANNALGALGVCSSELTTRLGDMESSLHKIRHQQQQSADMNAALAQIHDELSGETLDQRLEQAGIARGKHDGAAVLRRLQFIREGQS